MEQLDDVATEARLRLLGEELTGARLARWVANDRAVVAEAKVARLEEELGRFDERLRRLTDELLLERERRRAADAAVGSLTYEAAALRTTFWWRLGRVPRWLRRHIR